MNEAVDRLAHQPISDRDIEVLLASANAIQRLIDERNALRSRVDILERELARLNHQAMLYRRLTREFISQVQLAESAEERSAEQLGGTSGPSLHDSA